MEPLKPIIPDEWFDAFLDRVHRSETGCWEWTGKRNNFGYGHLDVSPDEPGKVYEMATHLSYMIFKGEDPLDHYVLHICDNPGCVNPDHLYLGNQYDNMHDAINRGRFVYPSVEPKLSDGDIREIRKERALGTTVQELSDRYDITYNYISQIGRGFSRKNVKDFETF